MAGLYPDIKKIQSLAVEISSEKDLQDLAVDIALSHISNLREIIFVVEHEDRIPETMFIEHIGFSEPEIMERFLWQRW